MPRLMRCQFCGTLQDEPQGAKVCVNCGGELAFETGPQPSERDSYVQVQMELDQVMVPSGQNVERHLLITVRTPAQVPVAQQAQSAAGRPPLNFTAVLDVSGSMAGDKLARAKQALQQAIARLYDGDVVSLVVFSTHVRCVFEPAVVNPETRRIVLSAVQEITTHENTNLCGGLEMGLYKVRGRRLDSNLVLLLSDGLANEGVTDLDQIAARALEGRQQGITVSTIGVGDDYNEALMVAIADKGGGRFCHVARAGELAAFLTSELGDVANAAARGAQIHLAIPAGAILLPFSDAYLAQQDGNAATVQVGDVPCDTELEIALTATLPAQQDGVKLSFEGALEYLSPAGNRLRSSLNRVTLRIVAPSSFQLREGVAAPVVERVLEQLKATSVLNVSRTLRQAPGQATQQERMRLDKVRTYAALLGDERAAKEAGETESEFLSLRAAPAAAKQTVAAAYYRTRNPKKSGEK